MKKSTILTFATAAAIVATSAGTFAAWDQTEATTNAQTLTVGKPVVLSAGELASFTPASRTLGVDPTYTSQVTFNVQDDGSLVNKLTLTPSLKDEAGQPVSESLATVELTQDGVDNGLAGNVDSKIEATNIYNVKVTILDESLADAKLSVTVAGVLE